MITYKQWLNEAFTSPESKLAIKTKIRHGLLVVPRTVEASRKYGMNTTWCITYTSDDNYWNDYIGNQKLTPYFVIVDKDWAKHLKADYPFDDLSKIAIMINKDGTVRHIWDANDKNLTTQYDMDVIEDLLNNIGVDINKLKPLDIEVSTETQKFTKEDYIDLISLLSDDYSPILKFVDILEDDYYYKLIFEMHRENDYNNMLHPQVLEDNYEKILFKLKETNDVPSDNSIFIHSYRKILVESFKKLSSKTKTIIKDK